MGMKVAWRRSWDVAGPREWKRVAWVEKEDDQTPRGRGAREVE